MSDIKVGDLVVVILPTPCCGDIDSIGYIFTVTDIPKLSGECSFCNDVNDLPHAMSNNGLGYDLCRLKKINPDQSEDEMLRIVGLPEKVSA